MADKPQERGGAGADPSAPGAVTPGFRFETLAARLSRTLGAASGSSLDAAMEECLEHLGRYAGADAAVVVLTDDDECVSNDWRWIRDGRQLTPPAPGSPLADTFGSAAEFLRLGVTVSVDDIDEVDLAPSERAIATANGMRSMLIAPVRIGTTLLGLVSLQVLDRPHHWDRTIIGQVEMVAQLVVQAISRTWARGELAAADARARRIAEHIPDGLLLLDPSGTISWVSPSFVRASGMAAGELIGRPVHEVAHPGDQAALAEAIAASPDSGSGTSTRVRAGDGWRWTDLSWQLAHEPDASVPDEIVLSLRDVHDRHVFTEMLARESERDTLTGLLNRVGLERLLAQQTQQGGSVILGFVDIDRFKTINDTLGHAAGDTLLQQIGGALRSVLREPDAVARVGGDEFCVVIHVGATDRATHPASIGDRLLGGVAEALAGVSPTSTISIGLAGPGPASAAETLLLAADEAMYRAKRAGGDRFDIARPS